MNRRRRSALSASPLLIGALTTLIVVVAVYLSYNANNGLPFTPTYNIKAELPEASGLEKGNEVRVSGERVGVISSLTPHENPRTGKLTAIANLKLEKQVEPLPRDTNSIVESVSTIGLRYLELKRGQSHESIPQGGTIPLSQSHESVQIQSFFNMFNKPTRIANQKNLNTLGDAFAGRGLGLNATIGALRPLVKNAVPVLHNLASPQTNLRQLFVALDKAANQVAPVAYQQAAFFDELDRFFTEFAGAAPGLEQTIAGGPEALRQAIHSFPYEAPFIEKGTEFMRLLRPSASVLRTIAAPLGHAFAVGAVNIRAASAVNSELASALKEFEAFAQNPEVAVGLEAFTNTAVDGNPLLAGITPAQTKCNYISLAFRNVASLLAESVGVGTLARALPVLSTVGPNSEGIPASAPANGPSEEYETLPDKQHGKLIPSNYLHYNPYPNVGGPGQPDVCEAGNVTYKAGEAVIGNVSTSGTAHEVTKRDEDLFGEKYPSATLKNLPSETATGKTEAASKSGSQGSGKGKSGAESKSGGKGRSGGKSKGKGA